MNIPYGPILVVEDIPNVLELLEVTLRFKGYPVVTARNGQEALEIYPRERPALVITDILMPTMDGFCLAHTLRKDPRTSQSRSSSSRPPTSPPKIRYLRSAWERCASLRNRSTPKISC